MSVFLETRAIHKRFAGVHALRGVSLSFEAGQVYHLLGENGCGKSTLIKILSGAQPPDEGELLVEGRPYPRMTPIGALAAGIETVYQDLSLIPNQSVEENIGLTRQLVQGQGALMRRLDRAAMAELASRALQAVGLPTDRAFRTEIVDELPIATRQLVAIARAIASRARLVIMDEPTTALTRREVDALVQVVRGLQADGVAVLFVTHKLDESYAIGGNVIVMRDGQLVLQGPISGYTKAQLSTAMTGRELSETRYRELPAAESRGEVRLRVQSLTGRAAPGRDKPAFRDVSFDLHAGEILGVTGLLDSGRNELALALAGVAPAVSGQVLLSGETIVLDSAATAIGHRIGYVPEDRLNEGLFLDRSIEDNVVTGSLSLLKGRGKGRGKGGENGGEKGGLKGRMGMLDFGAVRRLATSTVLGLNIATPDVVRPVQSLSGGNQQRVLIGRWLAIAPRVLILHGPTVGVDVGSKDTIYRIIQRLAREGLSVLLVSDDLPELLQNADRIVLMRDGTVARIFDAEQTSQQQLYEAMIGTGVAA